MLSHKKNGKFAFWSVLSLTRIDERVQVKLVCTNRILFTPLIISAIRKPFLAKLNSLFAIASKLFLFFQRPLLLNRVFPVRLNYPGGRLPYPSLETKTFESESLGLTHVLMHLTQFIKVFIMYFQRQVDSYF